MSTQLTFKIKQNDRAKYLKVTVFDSTGSAKDLSGLDVVFNMRSASDKSIKISRGSNVVVTDAENGEMEYRWQDGDTDTAGAFEAEFETINDNGEPLTFPEGEEFIDVIIGDDIA